MTKNKLLDSNQLKIIAIAAMTVDHIAWMLFPGYPREALPVIMHIIGRLTCPIMCYFIAEGYHYTKNIKKYTFRLFLFHLYLILHIFLHLTILLMLNPLSLFITAIFLTKRV